RSINVRLWENSGHYAETLRCLLLTQSSRPPVNGVADILIARSAGGHMKGVVVIGAGKIGATVAGLLASTGDYQVTLADRSSEILGNLDRDERIRVMAADVEDSLKLVDLLNGQFAVLNAAPFHLTKPIAEAARAAGTHYLDLTEDVVSTRRVR